MKRTLSLVPAISGMIVSEVPAVAQDAAPSQILIMATGNAGELFKMSVPNQNLYPDGDLGVVKEGACAELPLVDGNPLEDLDAVTDPENLRIIMKDGVIYKNALD